MVSQASPGQRQMPALQIFKGGHIASKCPWGMSAPRDPWQSWEETASSRSISSKNEWPHGSATERVVATPLSDTSLLPCFPPQPVLYPNLAELDSYMGLSLSSQEVQQSLSPSAEGSTVRIRLLPAFLVLLLGQTSCVPVFPSPLSPRILGALFLNALSIVSPHEKQPGVSMVSCGGLPFDLWLQAARWDESPSLGPSSAGCL